MDQNTQPVSRRGFVAGSLAGVALAGLPPWFAKRAAAQEQEQAAPAPRRIGPNDKIVFGAIGMGGSKGGYRQGLQITRAASRQPGVQVVAVCDVDRGHREDARKAFGPDTKAYIDYRELLERPDIDAVTIGAPDHWHAVMAIDAMRAGKDVYCEKPLTLTIDEGKKLVEVAKTTGRVFQTGSQQRSDKRFHLACALVRNHRIGRITRVETHLPGAPTGGPWAPQPVPADLDWNRWLGPAPFVDYVPQRTHGSFRWWYEYSGGMLTDWGAHHNDIAQWGLNMDRSGPVRVASVGKPPKPGPNAYNVHPAFDITYTYENGVTLFCTNQGRNGVRFEGDAGWIFVSRNTIEASDPKLLEEPLPSDAVALAVSTSHMGNFVDCIRSRNAPICDAETGHRSVSVCHLGTISLRLGGRTLDWDPRAERFKNDPEADALLGRVMRRPWSV